MLRSRPTPDLAVLWDALLVAAAAAYLLGFVAALQAALGRLFYY